MPDGDEADRFKSGVHKARVFEAVTATTACDDLGLQAFGVEANRPAEKDVEAFEGDAGDMGLENSSEGVVGRVLLKADRTHYLRGQARLFPKQKEGRGRCRLLAPKRTSTNVCIESEKRTKADVDPGRWDDFSGRHANIVGSKSRAPPRWSLGRG